MGLWYYQHDQKSEALRKELLKVLPKLLIKHVSLVSIPADYVRTLSIQI
jgi:hypothetical protein